MNLKEPKKRLRFVPLFVILLLVFGVAGFMIIEGWNFIESLYSVVLTVSSLGGFPEVHKLSPEGRVFTVFLVILGVFIILYSLRWFSDYIIEGKLYGELRRKRMEKKISSLKNHFIICGLGRTGRRVAENFAKENIDFVVIDDLSDKSINVDELCQENGWPHIFEDASKEAVLKRAGVKVAKGLIAATGDDAYNVFIALSARSLNPKIFIVARANHRENVSKLEKAGADEVIIPHQLGGEQMAQVALDSK